MAERIALNIPTPPGVSNVTAEVPEGYFKPEHIPTTIEDIQVGDVFHSHCNATMACNYYYKVIKRTAKFVTLRKLRDVEVDTDFLRGVQYPLDEFSDHSCMYDGRRKEYPDGKVYCEVTRRLPDKLENGRIWIKISDWEYASPWDGRLNSFDHAD
jgi:hypothetical protein